MAVARAYDPTDEQNQPLIADPVEAALSAGLVYFTDARPGIRRKRAGKHFSYIGLDGKPIHDTKELQRIRSLGIPPAWTDVWISPTARGHIQATGRDAKGRKQYRYHNRWREVRDETKYSRMLAFGEALPIIRERTDLDLTQRCLSREKVLATVVRLLDETAIRVGNEEYARSNRSFGLTTLRTRHVKIDGSTIRFHFRGKSGKDHIVSVRDRRLARAVQRCHDIPGQELFQYLDDDGARRGIDSADVNVYLRQITGQNFTAKDFRTWHGSVTAARSLWAQGPFESQTEAKRHIARAVEAAADHLGNTPAIARKSYVHPALLESYGDGTFLALWERAMADAEQNDTPGLEPEEVALLAVLQHGLEAATNETALVS
jgi:DNA topoisomerase-1